MHSVRKRDYRARPLQCHTATQTTRHSNTSRVELSPADCSEHFGHTKSAGHRLWGMDSRQARGVKTRRRHARMSFGYSGRPMPASFQ